MELETIWTQADETARVKAQQRHVVATPIVRASPTCVDLNLKGRLLQLLNADPARTWDYAGLAKASGGSETAVRAAVVRLNRSGLATIGRTPCGGRDGAYKFIQARKAAA